MFMTIGFHDDEGVLARNGDDVAVVSISPAKFMEAYKGSHQYRSCKQAFGDNNDPFGKGGTGAAKRGHYEALIKNSQDNNEKAMIGMAVVQSDGSGFYHSNHYRLKSLLEAHGLNHTRSSYSEVLSISNGRHRLAAMANCDVEEAQVIVPRDQAKIFEWLYSVGETELCPDFIRDSVHPSHDELTP